MNAREPERIVFLNFGGIGDEILFAPVIQAVKQAYPNAHCELILESRSESIHAFLPEIDEVIGIDVSRLTRVQLSLKLRKCLRQRYYDVAISSGSSQFIAMLLASSKVPITVGFDTGYWSQRLLTVAAPLNKKTYAAEMYFSLAQAFLAHMKRPQSLPKLLQPRLPIQQDVVEKAEALLMAQTPFKAKHCIVVHPGVSQQSIRKNILKAWPSAYWGELFGSLLNTYPESIIYVVGGPDDAEVIQQMMMGLGALSETAQERIVNLYGQTKGLMDLGGILSQADVFISVDSAPMHLAVALEVPTVAIFAPTDPKKLLPSSPLFHAAVRDDLACRPCLWDVRQDSCGQPVCLQVPVAVVMDKVQQILAPLSSSVVDG